MFKFRLKSNTAPDCASDQTPAPLHPSRSLRAWHELGPDEQLTIQIEFGHYLDTLPPSCSMETKIARLREWLRAVKGIDYGAHDPSGR
ncbi:MAG: hypothetical protein ACPGU7_10220 [Gammaproteobacteria bacterium]